MKRVLFASLLLSAACGAKPGPALEPDAPETAIERLTVFTGGTIYTGLEDPKTVSSVVVGADGRILATAPPASEDWAEDEIERIDLGGAVMYPGFVDAHVHLAGVGQRELTLNLAEVGSVAELVEIIAGEAEGRAPGEIIFGRGWIETGWPEGRMPDLDDLDPVSPDNPVILIRADGHALVANSAALDAAGIGPDTPDPDGGKIERGEDGSATGVLIDNAKDPVTALLSEPTEEDRLNALAIGAKVYASRGWSGAHAMSVNPDEAPLMARLDQEGRLPLRVHNAYDEAGFEIAAGHGFETDTIQNRAVKIYMDGALGSRGAQLTAPYSDRPDTSGLSLITDEHLVEVMQRAADEDVQLAIHAIGDLANQRIIDTVEARFPEASRKLRWRIEHTQILRPEDVERLAPIGLVASMQPSHAIGDMFFAPARLGLGRLDGAYAWNSLIDAGAVLAGGSDAPVEVGSPLIEFYAAVERRGLNGYQDENWRPGEAVSRENALKMFTLWPAYASFQEDDLGSIEPGKLADFSVFDRDLMTVPAEEILQAKAVMTVVNGEIVYDERAEAKE